MDLFLCLKGEIFAGAVAGGINAVFVNPIEMIKIRIQVGGEVGKKITTMYVLRDIGFFGMQKVRVSLSHCVSTAQCNASMLCHLIIIAS
jgi:hypothetical protein